jgi:hypothetical protein
VAQQCCLATGEYRGKPIPVLAHSHVTYGESLAMKTVETASPQPSFDRVLAEAECQKLTSSHDAVLPGRQPSQFGFACLLAELVPIAFASSSRACPSFWGHMSP